MLVLSRREVERLLDLDALVEAVASAMADLSAGRASMPGRAAAEVGERSALLAVMPAYVPAAGALRPSSCRCSLSTGPRPQPIRP